MTGSPQGINCTPCRRSMKTKKDLGDTHCRKKDGDFCEPRLSIKFMPKWSKQKKGCVADRLISTFCPKKKLFPCLLPDLIFITA